MAILEKSLPDSGSVAFPWRTLLSSFQINSLRVGAVARSTLEVDSFLFLLWLRGIFYMIIDFTCRVQDLNHAHDHWLHMHHSNFRNLMIDFAGFYVNLYAHNSWSSPDPHAGQNCGERPNYRFFFCRKCELFIYWIVICVCHRSCD